MRLSLQRLCSLDPVLTAWIFGFLHALIDTTSAAVLYHQVAVTHRSYPDLGRLVLTHNCLAFGLQPLLGWLSDRISRGPRGDRIYRSIAALGAGLAALAVLQTPHWPFSAAVSVALGNALFHVGAGAIVLRHCQGRAALPGVFVAPGAFGVWLGVWIGGNGLLVAPVFVPMLVGSGLFLAFYRTQAPDGAAAVNQFNRPRAVAGLCVSALLISVSVRSLAGGVFSSAGSHGGFVLGLAVTLAAVLGKSVGGALADRAGWRAFGVVSLLTVWGLQLGETLAPPQCAVASMFLIQLATPVTLTATFLAMPRFPGTAFGLPALAFYLGALPSQLDRFGLAPAEWLWLLLPASAILLYLGLVPVSPGAEEAHPSLD